jgi:hypothetical protein
MLTENDVIVAVVAELKRRGYSIPRTATTVQRGIDIEATSSTGRRTILIEVKGETTSKAYTARHGMPFTRNQCRTHIAVALFAAAKARDAAKGRSGQLVAIALPDAAANRDLVGPIRKSIRALGIGLFWVSPEKSVQFEGPWRL